MSSKSSSKKKNNGVSTPELSTAPAKKIKIPKSFIVRPNVPTNNKSVANVYINPEILSAMELNNGNLVLVSSSDSGSAGVVATVYSSNDIVDKMLLPYPSGTDNSVDFCLVIELNSSNL